MKKGAPNMNLTSEQQKYIVQHLRDPEKTYAIAALATKISEKNKDMHLEQEETKIAALIMNIGETSDKMKINGVSIYSKEYGPWDVEEYKAGSWDPEGCDGLW